MNEPERTAKTFIESNFNVTPLSTYEKPPGLTAKDIDIYLLVNRADYLKIKNKIALSTYIYYNSKPIDIFITDGRNVLVSKQISPQEILFTERPIRYKLILPINIRNILYNIQYGDKKSNSNEEYISHETISDAIEVIVCLYDIMGVLAGGSEAYIDSEYSLLQSLLIEKLNKTKHFKCESIINKVLPELKKAIDERNGALAHFWSRMIVSDTATKIRDVIIKV